MALKLTITKKLLTFLFLLVMVFAAKAQTDIHYSQFKNAPLLLSPALTGVFDGNSRVMVNYKAQWYTVPVSYRTAYASFDTKLFTKKENYHFFGLGAEFSYDHAGDSKFGSTSLGLNGSYTHKLTKAHYATLGVQVKGTQRAFKTDDLTFDQQYNGEVYDPQALNNEDFSNTSTFYADFSAGLNWHYQKPGKRTNFNIGGGWFHINEPNVSFWNETDVLWDSRFDWYGLGQFQVANSFDVLLHAVGKYQGPNTEQLIGAAGRIHLNQTVTKRLALDLGLAYRWNTIGFSNGDALIPSIELNYKDWLFGISYDINLTDFKTASEGYGGPEFAVHYIFRPAPDVDFCPTCPVYMEP